MKKIKSKNKGTRVATTFLQLLVYGDFSEQKRTEHNFFLTNVSVHTQVEFEKNEYIKQNTCIPYITWQLFCIYGSIYMDMIDVNTCKAQFRNIYIAECTLH